MRQLTRLQEIERKLSPPENLKIAFYQNNQEPNKSHPKQRGLLVVKLADVDGLQITYNPDDLSLTSFQNSL